MSKLPHRECIHAAMVLADPLTLQISAEALMLTAGDAPTIPDIATARAEGRREGLEEGRAEGAVAMRDHCVAWLIERAEALEAQSRRLEGKGDSHLAEWAATKAVALRDVANLPPAFSIALLAQSPPKDKKGHDNG